MLRTENRQETGEFGVFLFLLSTDARCGDCIFLAILVALATNHEGRNVVAIR